jgi:Dimerisation domain
VSEEPQSKPGAPPPHVQLIQMATGYWISKILYVAAKLELADRLAESPRSADELAAPTGTHAPSVHRLLRALASLGVFTEREGQRFALTPLGEALRSGAPGSARATILTLAGPTFWRAWDEALYSFETGKTAFEKVFGMPAFDYLARHPERRLSSARPWWVSTARRRPPSPLRMTSRGFGRSWTWAAPRATSWPRF